MSLINDPAYQHLNDWQPPDLPSSPPPPTIIPSFISVLLGRSSSAGGSLHPCSVDTHACSDPLHLNSAFQPAAFAHTYPGAVFIRLLKGRPRLGVTYKPDPLDPAIRSIFEAWHEANEQDLANFIDASQLDVSGSISAPASIVTDAFGVDIDIGLAARFISSFNPAVAGLNGLILERLDQLAPCSRISPRRVSVSLDGCRPMMRDFALSNMCLFPAIMETVLNSIGPLQSQPLIVDTGASCCISPNRADFIHYTASKAQVRDLSGTNKVAGEGIIRWVVKDHFHRDHVIEMKGYHMPNASVRLLSPQSLFDAVGGHGVQNREKYSLHLPGDIQLDAPYGRANLPVLPLVDSDYHPTCLWAKCFAFSADDKSIWSDNILAAANQNLSLAQKELLLWHQRLSHAGLSAVQNLCRQRRSKNVESVGELIDLRDGPCLPCAFDVPSTCCAGLKCAACLNAKANRRAASVRPLYTAPTQDMVLKTNHVHPGDCVSLDHYQSPVLGRRIHVSGHSSTRHGYSCGTIFADHASGLIWIHHQQSNAASDTIRGKLKFEQEAAEMSV